MQFVVINGDNTTKRDTKILRIVGVQFVIFLLILLFIADFASAEVFTVDENEYDPVRIPDGTAGDIWTIDLVSASGSVDLYLFEEDEYNDLGSLWETAEYSWGVKGVTSGEWVWTQPTDEKYILVVDNNNDFDITYEIIFYGETDIDDVDSICCTALMIPIGLILVAFCIAICLKESN